MFLEAVLKREGFETFTATNGREAVKKAIDGLDIDIVIMDLSLPHINGFEATRTIKANREDIPIIAYTAHVMNNECKQAKEAGCDDFISKSPDIEELRNILMKYDIIK